jgi:hypothetical protein
VFTLCTYELKHFDKHKLLHQLIHNLIKHISVVNMTRTIVDCPDYTDMIIIVITDLQLSHSRSRFFEPAPQDRHTSNGQLKSQYEVVIARLPP